MDGGELGVMEMTRMALKKGMHPRWGASDYQIVADIILAVGATHMSDAARTALVDVACRFDRECT